MIYGKHTRTWVNLAGRGVAQRGAAGLLQSLTTSFYQPLDVAQRLFVEPRLLWTRSWEDVFYDNERLARYQFSDAAARLDVGVNLGDDAQVRIGYLYTRAMRCRNRRD